MPERVAATRRIAAPAATIFRIVSNPAGHVQIDGSGMLTASESIQLTEVGQTFGMDMDRRPLGDIPNMAEYQVTNTVTQIVPDRLFEWTIGGANFPPLGHVYGWQIDPVNDTECDVTNYCDWSNINDDLRARTEGRWPIVPLAMLEQSVAKLEEIATKP